MFFSRNYVLAVSVAELLFEYHVERMETKNRQIWMSASFVFLGDCVNKWVIELAKTSQFPSTNSFLVSAIGLTLVLNFLHPAELVERPCDSLSKSLWWIWEVEDLLRPSRPVMEIAVIAWICRLLPWFTASFVVWLPIDFGSRCSQLYAWCVCVCVWEWNFLA